MSKIKKFPQMRNGPEFGKCGCGSELFKLVMHNGYFLGIQCANDDCGLYVENDSDDKSEFIVDVDD